MAHQSLYRRYRSQNFAEILGQEHVTTALRNAVAEGRNGHAYLFSGPRGTGKTSTARVLAKALNCQNLEGGEPCGTCASCVDIENGKSFDLHELDAASNNKVDDVRELIAKVALGSPGRTKVYILDEVHMLSPGAENALLKTLEEPPDHVVFVLATTEPHKVVETIRSRTQHYEFSLLPAAVLEAHVRRVIADAELEVDEAGIEYAIRQGGGSARDTLSALDLVAAAGGVPEGSDAGRSIAMAIGAADPGATITAVQHAIGTGREPRTIGEATLRVLRNAFLAAMGAPQTQLSEADQAEATEVASTLGAATITRSLEVLGQALVEMRQAADPRVPLEVALLRLARREGNDTAALVQRIETLEREVAELRAGGAPAAPAPATTARPRRDDPPPPAPARPAPTQQAPSPDASALEAAAPAPSPTSAPTPSTDGATVSLGQLVSAFDDGSLLDGLEQRVRTRFGSGGRFLAVDGDTAVFGVKNAPYQSRVDEVKGEVERAIHAKLGAAVKIDVVVDDNPSPPPGARSQPSSPAPTPTSDPVTEIDDVGDVSELADAGDIAASSVDRITQAFPGATVVPPPNQ